MLGRAWKGSLACLPPFYPSHYSIIPQDSLIIIMSGMSNRQLNNSNESISGETYGLEDIDSDEEDVDSRFDRLCNMATELIKPKVKSVVVKPSPLSKNARRNRRRKQKRKGELAECLAKGAVCESQVKWLKRKAKQQQRNAIRHNKTWLRSSPTVRESSKPLLDEARNKAIKRAGMSYHKHVTAKHHQKSGSHDRIALLDRTASERMALSYTYGRTKFIEIHDPKVNNRCITKR